MKTKTLILTAALSVAGLASSHAQVFSSNAVGYVNLTLTAGSYNLITNPLFGSDNSVSALFPDLGTGSQVITWDGAGFIPNNLGFGGWGDPDLEILPGEGCFVYPAGSGDVTVTFVGEVQQGDLMNALPAGFTLVGSQVPQAGTATELGLADDLATGAQVLKWSGSGYIPHNLGFGGWTPSEPSFTVGEGFFVYTDVATSWDLTFSVNE
jgi:hypothetical protein